MKSVGVPPVKTDPALRKHLERSAEVLEVLAGNRGNPMDRAVTVKDLVTNGFVRPNISLGEMGGGVRLTPAFPIQDMTPPPQAVNFTVAPIFGGVILSWDVPAYGNHLHTQILRATSDNPSEAVVVATAASNVHREYLPDTATYYYWVKLVSRAYVVGPLNQTAGTPGASSGDPTFLLEQLTGQLSESHLVTNLNTRINLIDGADTLVNSVAWRVKQETDARIAAISAETSARITAINDEAAARAAAIIAEADARIAADSTLNTLITNETSARVTADNVFVGNFALLGAKNGSGTAWQMDGSTVEVRNDADSGWVSLGAKFSSLVSRMGTAEAAITTETTTRAAADSAFASQFTLLGATNGPATAWQLNNSTVEVRNDADNGWVTIGTKFSSLVTRANDSESSITNLQTVTTNMASDVTTLQTTVSGHTSSINTLNTTTSSHASSIAQLQTDVGDNAAAITNEATTRANADSALSSQFALLGATNGPATAWQMSGTTVEVRNDADNGWVTLGTKFSSLVSRIGTAESSISTIETVNATQATQISTLTTTVDGHGSSITSLNTTTASHATSISQLNTTVDDHTAAIATKANTSVVTGIDGRVTAVEAEYTVKLDVNGRVAGFGLSSVGGPTGATSEFVVIADKFAIVRPSNPGETPSFPFVVGQINGTTAVGITGNLIVDGTITTRHILANSITANKLSVGELSAITANMGAITAGSLTLSTTGFVRGGATSFSAGSGFWVGYDGGAYKLRIGSTTNNITWDGTTFGINGNLWFQDYTAGNKTILTAPTQRATSVHSFVKVKEFQVERPGVVRVWMEAKRYEHPSHAGVWTDARMRVLVNGSVASGEVAATGPDWQGIWVDVTVTNKDHPIAIQIAAGEGYHTPLEPVSYTMTMSIQNAQIRVNNPQANAVLMD